MCNLFRGIFELSFQIKGFICFIDLAWLTSIITYTYELFFQYK